MLQTDYGVKDGAVGAIHGVAAGVSPRVVVHDLSHDNTPYDIWEAAYRLKQAAPFWPRGTVFVSVVDPGVGTERKSVVLQTRSGHTFVGPDNGTWTFVAEDLGIAAVREIDEARLRRPGSEASHTFHGRDIYAYVGAKLAAGQLALAEVGPAREVVVMLPYERPRIDGAALVGAIPVHDYQYGNVWTNIGTGLWERWGGRVGDRYRVTIARAGQVVLRAELPLARTFGDVPEGAPLLYVNSLMNLALAINLGNFAQAHGIGRGGEWSVRIEKLNP